MPHEFSLAVKSFLTAESGPEVRELLMPLHNCEAQIGRKQITRPPERLESYRTDSYLNYEHRGLARVEPSGPGSWALDQSCVVRSNAVTGPSVNSSRRLGDKS